MGDTVRYELDGHVATITYDRPERLNAVNGELPTVVGVPDIWPDVWLMAMPAA